MVWCGVVCNNRTWSCVCVHCDWGAAPSTRRTPRGTSTVLCICFMETSFEKDKNDCVHEEMVPFTDTWMGNMTAPVVMTLSSSSESSGPLIAPRNTVAMGERTADTNERRFATMRATALSPRLRVLTLLVFKSRGDLRHAIMVVQKAVRCGTNRSTGRFSAVHRRTSAGCASVSTTGQRKRRDVTGRATLLRQVQRTHGGTYGSWPGWRGRRSTAR